MGNLPIIKPDKLVRKILMKGFWKDRQSGSHLILINKAGKRTSIPMHRKTLGKGLLHKILKDTGITVNDLK